MNQQQGKNRQLLLTLNFQDGTLMLNEGILVALGRPGQVQILLNKEAKRLLSKRSIITRVYETHGIVWMPWDRSGVFFFQKLSYTGTPR